MNGTGWHLGLVHAIDNRCDPRWSDDFETGIDGWQSWAYPIEAPPRGTTDPVLDNGGLRHPVLGGSPSQSGTLLNAQFIREEPSDCTCQSVEFSVSGMRNPYTSFRSYSWAILFANPDTGSQFRVNYSQFNGFGNMTGTGQNSRVIMDARMYYGPGGSDYNLIDSFVGSELITSGAETVDLLNVVLCRDTGEYYVTLNGVTLMSGAVPLSSALEGTYQGVGVRWDGANATPFVGSSPTIQDANGGALEGF